MTRTQAQTMGIGVLGNPGTCFKRKFRWLFIVPEISGEGTNVLPPKSGARPNLSFKEMDAQHINETIYYPVKPDWKPIPLKLYDLKLKKHPIYEWLLQVYSVQEGRWNYPFRKKRGLLKLFDGCGYALETWAFDNIYPSEINFGDLSMELSDVVTVDLMLRYDRAYLLEDDD